MATSPFNVELEQAIRDRPDELGVWRAYSDWLLARGHPRGELMAHMLDREQHPAAADVRQRDQLIRALIVQLDGDLQGFSLPGAGYLHGFKARHQFHVFDAQSLAKLERLVAAEGMRLLRHVILRLESSVPAAALARLGEVLADAAFTPGVTELELLSDYGLEYGGPERAAFARFFAACRRVTKFISCAELPVAPAARELRLTCSPGVAARIVSTAGTVQTLAVTFTGLEGAALALAAPLPELRVLRLSPVTAELLDAVLHAPVTNQLTGLDLEVVPEAVPALVAAAPRLAAVTGLTVRGLWSATPEEALVRAAFPRARIIHNVRL